MITMKKAIKNQFQLNENMCLAVFFLELGSFLAGVILFAFLMRFIFDEGEGTFPLGTMIAAFLVAVLLFSNFVDDYTSRFYTQISLGCTRKDFFVSMLLNELLLSAFGMAALLVFASAEDALNIRLYPAETPEFVIFPFLWRYGIVAVMGFPAAAALVGALSNRFGQAVRTVFVVLWMAFWIGMPQVVDVVLEPETETHAAVRSIARMITAVPSRVWPVVGVVAFILALGMAWMLVRTQQVN